MAAPGNFLPGSGALPSLVKLVTVVLVVAVLYLAQEVFKPVALAVLLSFLLAPLVRRIERLGAPRSVAVVSVAGLAFLLLGLVIWVAALQVVDLADSIVDYRQNIIARVRALRPEEGGALGRASEAIDEIRAEIEGVVGPEAPAEPVRPKSRREREQLEAARAKESTPVPVTMVETHSPVQLVWSTLAPLLSPLATMGVIVVFVIFFLIEREELRNRLIRLAGESRLLITTEAMTDAGSRVSSYLLMQLVVNLTYGVPVWLGLWAIGIPNAPLWGFLGVLLRYLPYIGPWITAICPIVLSLAVFEGWLKPVLTVSLFLALELIVNNLVEPFAYGSRTGLSPVALLLAALFWTWLWGPVGLVLAAPLTVCLVVIGRYAPHLEFLSVLFGDEPALSPAARLYQRLVVGDQVETLHVVQSFLRDHDRVALFDEVLVPALELEEHDRHRGALSEIQAAQVQRTLRELCEAIDDGQAPALADGAPRVVCLPARDDADALAAEMLAYLATTLGVARVTVASSGLAGEVLELLERERPDVICISVLPPAPVIHARYLCKRLRARHPDRALIVGLWSGEKLDAPTSSVLREAGASLVVGRFADALEFLRTLTVLPRTGGDAG